jgi:hypothetical protein
MTYGSCGLCSSECAAAAAHPLRWSGTEAGPPGAVTAGSAGNFALCTTSSVHAGTALHFWNLGMNFSPIKMRSYGVVVVNLPGQQDLTPQHRVLLTSARCEGAS